MYSLMIMVLIGVGSYFSVVETALISVNRRKMKLMAENGNEKEEAFYQYVTNISSVVTMQRIVITLVKVSAGMVGGLCLLNPIQSFLQEKGILIAQKWQVGLLLLLLALLISMGATVFIELVPKRIGVKFSEKIAYHTMRKMKVLTVLFTPLIVVHTVFANFFSRVAGVDPDEVNFIITEEEIRMMVDAGGNTGSIDETEKEMINNIFDFDSTSVGEIAIHRTDILALPISAGIEDIKNVIIDGRFSRIPVYENSIDDIVGIFHVKDFAKYLVCCTNRLEDEGFQIRDMLREPYFVPFSKKSDELFKEMQKNKTRMAVIIDEYGGTAGIVTMEDLIEEIVGNIFDEYDAEEEEDIRIIEENVFMIKGVTDLADVEEFLNITLDEEEEYDTLGGFLIGHIGRIPDAHEYLVIEIGEYNFKLEKIVEKRIELVRVTKKDA